jgi:hypothetical protein
MNGHAGKVVTECCGAPLPAADQAGEGRENLLLFSALT